jgi:hypothetical protein
MGTPIVESTSTWSNVIINLPIRNLILNFQLVINCNSQCQLFYPIAVPIRINTHLCLLLLLLLSLSQYFSYIYNLISSILHYIHIHIRKESTRSSFLCTIISLWHSQTYAGVILTPENTNRNQIQPDINMSITTILIHISSRLPIEYCCLYLVFSWSKR